MSRFNALRNLLIALALLWAVPAGAATCFWVGGTGTWDNSTDAAHWSSGTGGSGSTCAATGGVPKNAGDVATLDGASGGGTVTNNVDINIAQITMGAFTGTLDFATNNKNVTMSTGFAGSGTGTRTLNMGNGTWTLSAASGSPWDLSTTTNLTLNANSSTIILSGNASSAMNFICGAGISYNAITVNSMSSQGGVLFQIAPTTLGTLTFVAPTAVIFNQATTYPVSNIIISGGSISQFVTIQSNNASNVATLSKASGTVTMNYTALRLLTFTGGATFNATNSVDSGRNTGVSITAPSAGSGGRIIGG